STSRDGQFSTSANTSGQLLTVAGSALQFFQAIASSELFDAETNTWSTTGMLATARVGHTATLLYTGQVLVTGGQNNGSELASAELYQPLMTDKIFKNGFDAATPESN
ncbi:MAG: hypothetical protein WAT76_07430, partial [Dokdonella sp.]|uniref:hypothetical protein n=1 Tax=Dokdonella sp. TaxID=2291710 RepID=UPI003BB155C8